MGKMRAFGYKKVFRRGGLLKSRYISWIAVPSLALVVWSVWVGGSLAQSRRSASQADRRPILARLLKPQSEEGRNAIPGVSPRQGSPEASVVALERKVALSEVSKGDIVVTKGAVELKMGKNTVAATSAGVGLRVIEVRGNWLGVVDARNGQEIRGWVKRDLVAPPRTEMRVEESHLGKAKDGIEWSSAAVTTDGKQIAYVVSDKKGSRVVFEGTRGEAFDLIEPGQPILGRGGKRVAYAAKRKREWFVVIDGTVNGPYESVQLGHPIISADESKIFAVVRKKEGQFLLVNGTEGAAYKEILEGSPLLSPDGKHYAYAAQSKSQWRVYLDGDELASFDEVAMDDMAFRIDGGQFACIGRRKGKASVHVGEEELASHEKARLPFFLPGEGGLCYQACDDGKWSVVVGPVRSEAFDEVGDFVLDPAQNGVAFFARDGDKWRVVRGEEKGPKYDGFGRGSLTLGAAGQRMAYVAVRDGKAVVVVDGKESGPYEGVLAGTPVFNVTGESVAYAALEDGVWRVYVDGVGQRAHESIVEYSLRFTPDGSLPLALVGRGDRLAVAIGDAVSTEDYLVPRGSLLLPVSATRFSMIGIRNEEFVRVEAEVESGS